MAAHEWMMQKKIVSWINNDRYHIRGDFYHCPNGGYRPSRTAYLLSLVGVKPGIPDMIFVRPCVIDRVRYIGLVIELKHGRVPCTPSQIHWLKKFKDAGNFVAVVRSIKAFKELVDDAYPCHDIKPCMLHETTEERFDVYRQLIECRESQRDAAAYTGLSRRRCVSLMAEYEAQNASQTLH